MEVDLYLVGGKKKICISINYSRGMCKDTDLCCGLRETELKMNE